MDAVSDESKFRAGNLSEGGIQRSKLRRSKELLLESHQEPNTTRRMSGVNEKCVLLHHVAVTIGALVAGTDLKADTEQRDCIRSGATSRDESDSHSRSI